MKRREVLQLLALGLVNAGIKSAWADTGRVSSAASKKGKLAYFLPASDQKFSVLKTYDWDAGREEEFLVPIAFPHSLLRDRTNPNVVFIFEVFGSCARVNLATKEYVKIDHTQAREMFNGHGIQSASGDFVLCSQLSRDFRDGAVVAMRDAKTLKKIGVAPKECNATHQLVQLPHTTVAACGNCANLDGRPGGGVTFYDYENRRVIQRINFPYPVVHLIPISPNEVIGIAIVTKHVNGKIPPSFSYDHTSMQNISAYSTGVSDFSGPLPLYYAKSDGTHKELWEEEKKAFLQDSFGLGAIPQSGSFLSSHSGSNSVILWKNFKIAKIFSVPSPTNLAVAGDGSEFLVLSKDKLRVFSLDTLAETKTIHQNGPVVLLSAY